MFLIKRIILPTFIFFLLLLQQAVADNSIVFKKGDTLYSISRKYNIPVDMILKYNKISDPTKIKSGTKINLPGYYIMKKGDTLYKLSRIYKVSVDEIRRINNINDSSRIKIGQKLLIPGAAFVPEKDPGGSKPSDNREGTSVDWPHPGKRENLDDILRGVIIHGTPGDSITAVSNGRVIWADPFRGFGKMLAIKNQDDYIYVYAGNEKLLRKVGDKVNIKDRIAVLGKNSHDGKAKVYFFIYKNGKAINPNLRY